MSELTSLTATRMRELLSRREVSSVELTRAHLAEIERRDAKIRAFTTVFRDQAIASATAADERRARGVVSSAIDGLPISIKESLDMEGLAATMGVVSRQKLRAAADAALVRQAREAGAVILGRTNVSQYLLYQEARNPLFGQTANPWNLDRTPGGSSGGEGAAIAAGMSAIGIGTDIAGSIRVPAHFCGIVGVKPTLDRWSNRGSNTAIYGQEAVRGQAGPMARTVADALLLMEAIDPVRGSALDGRVPPLPFVPYDKDVASLRIGFYDDDGLVPPSLAVARAVKRTVDGLRARGCEVVPFVPPRLVEHVFLQYAAMSADNGAIVRRGLEGSEVDPVIMGLRRVAEIPPLVRKGLARAALIAGEERVARGLETIGGKSVEQFWAITNQLRAWRFEVTDAMDRAGIDAIVCPPHATAALPHFGGKDFHLAASPSSVWNVLQFPAGVVPVTRVRADEAHRDKPRDRFEKLAAKVDEGSTGLPIGVQVVTRMWREDLCFAVMAAIEADVSADADFPKTPVE
jgi:fatty acid amide hydrolase